MPKRRRERDRPKAAPDSLYNPNKRVLLTYESDVEEDAPYELPDGTGHPAAMDAATANYKIEEYPDDEEDAIEGASGDAPAHEDDVNEFNEINENEEDQVNGDDNAPQKNDDSLWTRGGNHKNHTTGQWPALGSLSYQWEDGEEEEEYDSAEDEAMAYLRAVRSERQSMPTFLKVPDTYTDKEIYESGIGDARGYVEDGAYIGHLELGPTITEDAKTEAEPQEVFTSSLKLRFLTQRQRMHESPGPEALAALGDRHPITFPKKNNKAYAEWHKLIRNAAPQPSQVRAMEQITVLNLLELIQKHYLVREKNITTQTSAWIWALLARLDDVGTMDNDRVSAIRELGKRAILVQLSFNDAVSAEVLERSTEADDGVAQRTVSSKQPGTQPVEGQTFANFTGESSQSDSDNKSKEGDSEQLSARENTLATLDVIIALVGEIFGQRDLLEFRQRWSSKTKEDEEAQVTSEE